MEGEDDPLLLVFESFSPNGELRLLFSEEVFLLSDFNVSIDLLN